MNSRSVDRLAKRAYQRLETSPLARMLQIEAVQSYRARTRGVRDMSIDAVLQLVGATADVGVPCHLVGGWGVDALIGRQTRLHDDLDLAYEATPGAGKLVESALSRWGYRRVSLEAVPHGLFPVWILLSDGCGRSVDLLPMLPFDPAVPVEKPDQAGHLALPRIERDNFVVGRLGGRSARMTVSCLGTELQLASRERYEQRRCDALDIARLLRYQDRSVGHQRPPGRGERICHGHSK